MKNRILILIFTLFTSLLICSCEKEPYPVYKMSQEFKDYVVFQQGSFWVYEDSASKKLDTVRVIEAHTVMNINEDQRTNSEFYGSTLDYTSGLSSGYDSAIVLAGSAVNWSNPEQYTFGEFGTVLFTSHLKLGEKFGNSDLMYEKYIDSVIINNKNYSMVKVYRRTSGENYTIERTFHAPHIGIIRKELTNGEVWNLKTYQVNQ